MMRSFMGGVSLDAESLALEVIHKVGPGGDFLTADHTLSHFRDLWQPTLFDRRRMEDWVAAGSTRLDQRLQEKTVAIMEEHEPAPLPDEVRGEINYVLKNA